MSWFGGGSKKTDEQPKSSSSEPYSSYEPSSSEYSTPSSFSSSPSPSGGNSFQDELVAEQQKALVQAVMFKLTD
eukprot:gene38561-50642_t